MSSRNFTELDSETIEVAEKWARQVLSCTGLTEAVKEGYTVDDFEDSYEGYWESVAEFAEEYYDELLVDVPSELRHAISWDQVWDSHLRHEFTEIETEFSYSVHIFRDSAY